MEQISYNIINKLLKNENHLRGLAKDLKINHMSVKRALDKLVKENVLDVREQGRNNIFSLKKTLEAENYIYLTEINKLQQLIKKHPYLKTIIQELKKIKAELILLFGSYAKNTSTKNSDIDVYIETTDKKIKQETSKINSKISVKIGSYNKDNLLIKEMEKDHIVVKGAEKFYEKNKFFTWT